MIVISLIGLVLALGLGAAGPPAQTVPFCAPGQTPRFGPDFAVLNRQLGPAMGTPLECAHRDVDGNIWQQTSTGQAFYWRELRTPIFSAGQRHWAWTPAGLRQWPVEPEPGAALTTPLAVRVMSYNILFGAGVDPEWERAAAGLSPFAYPGRRWPQILEVIRAARPDIVGIQEAAGWQKGNPPFVQQAAAELGMHYFLAETGSGLHLALLSRFEISQAENLSAQVGNVGALRATLAVGRLLHVFIVHLDPFSAATRAAEITALTQLMAPYLDHPTLLLGDLNFYCQDQPAQCEEYRLLSQAGWQLALAGEYKLDQLWVWPGLEQPAQALPFPPGLFEISDHYPIGAVLELPPAP